MVQKTTFTIEETRGMTHEELVHYATLGLIDHVPPVAGELIEREVGDMHDTILDLESDKETLEKQLADAESASELANQRAAKLTSAAEKLIDATRTFQAEASRLVDGP